MGIDLEDAAFLVEALKRWGLQSHVFARDGEPSERSVQYERDRNRVERILGSMHNHSIGDRVAHKDKRGLGSQTYYVTNVSGDNVYLSFWAKGSDYVNE